MIDDNRLEAACALAFDASMREQGTHIRTANASELSIAFHYAAQAVAGEVQSGLREFAKSLQPEIEMMIAADYRNVDDAVSMACKLYDAIMDPEEAKP